MTLALFSAHADAQSPRAVSQAMSQASSLVILGASRLCETSAMTMYPHRAYNERGMSLDLSTSSSYTLLFLMFWIVNRIPFW